MTLWPVVQPKSADTRVRAAKPVPRVQRRKGVHVLPGAPLLSARRGLDHSAVSQGGGDLLRAATDIVRQPVLTVNDQSDL